ncbi:MAG TPA: condensation domain-containing protein [Ktedonobacteraceae bacterium]|jgi:acyl carrier protein
MTTKEELEKRRSGLSAAKQVLLEKRKQRIASLAEHAERIPRRPAGAVVPASFAQQRFWFIHQLKPENSAYNEIKTFRSPVPLDEQALRGALSELMRRHEILRSNFAFGDGQLQQIVHPFAQARPQLSLQVSDLGHVPLAAREQEAQRHIHAALTRPFDLAHGFPWRSLLLNLGEMGSLVVSVVHHILCDGWGLEIFEQELQALYLAEQAGQPCPLPELDLQYADFACWELQCARGDLWKQQQLYWQQRLADACEQPLLYGDHARQFLQQDAPRASLALTVPAAVTRELRALSAGEGVTLFMLLLAAFQLLLFQYSGQQDIIVGTPVTRRTRPELQPLIGCFLNMLVLRTDCSGDPTLRELLRRVRSTSLGAYANQDIPFEALVADLAPQRHKNRNPFFQVMLDFQNYQQLSVQAQESELCTRDLAADVTQFDLVLRLWDGGATLPGEIFYPGELFEAATVEHLRDRFLLLLSALSGQLTQPLSALAALSEAEQQIIARWNTARQASAADHEALFSLEHESSQDEQSAPRTPLEELLAGIWRQVLEIEEIGIYENFFRIGGHSLLATQLLVQLQEVLEIEIPLQLIFDAPTIAGLAEAIMADEQNRASIEQTIELLLSVTEMSEEAVETLLQSTSVGAGDD